MIKIHRWECLECDKKWYLKIDDSNEIDLIKLGKYEEIVSMHVMNFHHSMKHKERGDTIFKHV